MSFAPIGPDRPTDILDAHRFLLRRAAYVAMLVRFGISPGWSFEKRAAGVELLKAREKLEALAHEQQQIDPDFSLWNKHAHARCANGARWV